MRDEDYVKVMIEALADVLSEILAGKTVLELNAYVLQQLEWHRNWQKEMNE